MRYKATLGIAVALCVGAIAAAPALAGPVFKATEIGTEFTETEPGKSTTKNLPEQVQHFIFGPFHIQCPKAIGHGKVKAEQSKTFYQVVEFKECFVRAILFGSEQEIKLAAHFKSPVDIEFHANRWAEVGSESESELRLLNGQTITMGVPSIKCKIHWPAQVVPIKAEKNPEGTKFSAVKYENIEVEKLGPEEKILPSWPSGFQKQVIIESELKGMQYSLEGGQCNEFSKTEGENAKYTGRLKAVVVKGDLEVGEEEEVV